MNNEFRLTADQSEQRYHDIVHDAFKKTSPRRRPAIVMIAGQPGAGKSTMMERKASEFRSSGGALIVEVDAIRSYHPESSQLLRQGQPLNLVDTEARTWTKRLVLEAIDKRRNILISSLLLSTDRTWFFHSARDARYHIALWVIATPVLKSYLGLHQRYEIEVAKAQSAPPIPNPEHHRRAYGAIPNTLQDVETLGLVDQILVLNRARNVFYDSTAMQTREGAKGALEAERQRPWTQEACLAHIDEWEMVLEQMSLRGAARQESNRVKWIARGDAFRLLPEREALRRFPELGEAYVLLRSKQGGLHSRIPLKNPVEVIARLIETGHFEPIRRSIKGNIV
jgi:hypothetical protein